MRLFGKRPYVWMILVLSPLLLFFAGVGLISLLFSWFDIEEKPVPFSQAYALGGGARVFVQGHSVSVGFHGDSSTDYEIRLQFPGHQPEVVAQGYRTNENQPQGSFRLLKTQSHLYLVNESEIYSRGKNSPTWRMWSCRNQTELRYFGRAIMPLRYARNEKFADSADSQGNESAQHRLPAPPLYTFERFGSSERTLVMHQMGGNDYSDLYAEQTPSKLWPRRLVFLDWRLDVKRTLALEQKRQLRHLPPSVSVEILEMNFPNDVNWKQKIIRSRKGVAFYNYGLVTKIPSARIHRSYRLRLTDRFQEMPIMVQGGSKAPSILRIRGNCGDPNSNLVHYSWKLAGLPEHWSIAHNNQRQPLLQEQGSFLFMRFSWQR